MNKESHGLPESGHQKQASLQEICPQGPVIYEINTWVWLYDLTRKYGRQITLGNVPEEDWQAISALHPDAVWLMGVWERSPEGRRIAREDAGLCQECRQILSGWSPEDTVGSPYCIHRYVVDENLGGAPGLAIARGALSSRGIRLILDFVPNHTAPDHPWINEHPEYFIQGTADDLAADHQTFFKSGNLVIAHGRDPNFPAWGDTAQVNAFNPGLRKAALSTLLSIADQCDGVRCDMAMLLITNIFQRTWGARAGQNPGGEYWKEIISGVRKQYPNMIFMAEVYWDLELELQRQGFDYCYDKRFYDILAKENAASIVAHVTGDISYQKKLLRFIDNHDERKASAVFAPLKLRAAAVASSTLPGAKLFVEGQLEGRKIKIPVQLRRRPLEPADQELQEFYRRLLSAISDDTFHDGVWQLCRPAGRQNNSTYQNLVAWCWKKEHQRYLVVINWSPQSSQGYVKVPWHDINGKEFCLKDVITGATVTHSGYEMCNSGLYFDSPPWNVHFLKFSPTTG